MSERRFQVEVVQNQWSLDITVTCAERVGTGWIWTDNLPGVSLLPTDEKERNAVLKDALVSLIEHL